MNPAEYKLAMEREAAAANYATTPSPHPMPTEPSTSQQQLLTSSAITVHARISDFWTTQPRLWFHQFEAIVNPQKASDLHKYQLVIAKLGRDELGQISDILENPPDSNKYDTLRSRLISAYEESETKQLQKLLTEIELGDQKPSQLLRKMRELGRNRVPEETLKILWIGRLPHTIRAVITACDNVNLDSIATIADKIMETSRPSEVYNVQKPSVSSTILDQQLANLHLEIAAMNKKIIQMENTRRDNYRQPAYNRSRSRSRSRNINNQEKFRRQTAQPGDSNFKCFYHYIYGENAKKCGHENCSNKKSLN